VKSIGKCHNLSFGLATKVKVCKGACQMWSLGIISCSGSVGKCEWMNPHTPKWVSTLGIGV